MNAAEEGLKNSTYDALAASMKKKVLKAKVDKLSAMKKAQKK